MDAENASENQHGSSKLLVVTNILRKHSCRVESSKRLKQYIEYNRSENLKPETTYDASKHDDPRESRLSELHESSR